MYRYSTAICFLALFLGCRLTLAQTTESTHERIKWLRSTHDGFVQALENTKPLVLVILSNPSHVNEDGQNISNAQRIALDELQVHAMADEAVFVMAEFDHRLGQTDDEFANRIMKHTEVNMLPAVLVIANRTDKLSVTTKLEGGYQPEEIVSRVRSAIRQVSESLRIENAIGQTPTGAPELPRLEHNPYELQPMPAR